jgi:hypothetical protein
MIAKIEVERFTLMLTLGYAGKTVSGSLIC